jgi:hypothetical protein
VPQDQIQIWAAEAAANEAMVAADKLREKMLKRMTEFERALIPLQQMMRTLSPMERAYFVQRVQAELLRSEVFNPLLRGTK